MANRNNESSEAKKDEKLNNGKQEPGIGAKALAGTKAVVGFTGNTLQKLSSTGFIWIIGGIVAMMVADVLGLGLIGTAAVLGGIYVAVEGLKFLFSDKYAMQRETIKSKVSNVTNRQQAAA